MSSTTIDSHNDSSLYNLHNHEERNSLIHNKGRPQYAVKEPRKGSTPPKPGAVDVTSKPKALTRIYEKIHLLEESLPGLATLNHFREDKKVAAQAKKFHIDPTKMESKDEEVKDEGRKDLVSLKGKKDSFLCKLSLISGHYLDTIYAKNVASINYEKLVEDSFQLLSTKKYSNKREMMGPDILKYKKQLSPANCITLLILFK